MAPGFGNLGWQYIYSLHLVKSLLTVFEIYMSTFVTHCAYMRSNCNVLLFFVMIDVVVFGGNKHFLFLVEHTHTTNQLRNLLYAKAMMH